MHDKKDRTKKKTYKKLIVKKTYFFQHLCTLHHCTYKYTIHVTIVCVMLLSEPEPSSLYVYTYFTSKAAFDSDSV